MFKTSVRFATGLVALSVVFVSIASGQQPKEEFAKAQKDNAAALRSYTWKTRTEIKMKGESKSVKLEQVRYDLDGKLEKTPIDGAPVPAPAPAPAAKEDAGRHGRRGGKVKEKVIEKKKDEFAELLQNLGKLVASYAHMPPDKMQAFAAGAALTPNQGDKKDALLVQGKNVLQSGDTMSVWVDPKSYLFRAVEIQTSYEEKPVHFKGAFQPLVAGPTYPARSLLEYPDKEVELIVENYDYQKLGQ
jgi:hypothetical protein